MRNKRLLLLGLTAVVLALLSRADTPTPSPVPFGLVIHGGAGTMLRTSVNAAREEAYRGKLQEVLDTGYAVLERGGSAKEAVVAAIRVMEDSGLFNCGKGAVANADGLCELDAALMDGNTLAAGAVAGVQHIANPILLARAVVDHTQNVLLISEGAERLAKEQGMPLVPNSYFLHAKAAKTAQTLVQPSHAFSPIIEHEYGTVGCVALDQTGNLAAGTSTGGIDKKRSGRVGDSPIIGAGTYANNATCAVSGTGNGEAFMRVVVGHDVASQVVYAHRSLQAAADAALEKVKSLGKSGGIIVLGPRGEFVFSFNTPGMTRGAKFSDGRNLIKMFDDK